MVYKCSALNCRSGYTGENKDPNVTYHSFPLHDAQLLQTWLTRLARKDFTPTKHSKLCSRHFTSEDFVTKSSDLNNRRKKHRETTKLLRRRLKNDAVPSVFNNLPSYYTYKSVPRRSGQSSSSSRHENAAARLDERSESFMKADKIENFDDLIAKSSEELKRQSYLLHRTDQGAYFIHLTKENPPYILATIFIDSDLEVAVYQEKRTIPSSCYKHILPTNKVTLFSQVWNLVVFTKNQKRSRMDVEKQFQSNTTNLIVDFLLVVENEKLISFLKFVLEQINLAFVNKHHRRYSAELMMMAYVIFSTSPRAYERLLEEQILFLPSTKTLKKITMNLDSKTGLDDRQYLQLRFSQLNAFDRNIIIMIDEIYLSKRIEAMGGHVFGLTDNCQIATTALCFMVKSLSSEYQDMVGIYPIKNLKAATQKQCFDKIMFLLNEIGFNIVGISVDNAAANRKFYEDFLCGGSWKASITNPFTGGQIFLIFDPTHVIKNIYNNLLTRKVFKLPALDPLVPKALTATFSDIATVFDKECDKPLRIAHKLSETVLNPKTIEKVNVKLAVSLLHESTIEALKHYGFSETANVLDLFSKFWAVLNVASLTIGKHKRDIVRDPVRSPDDWKLEFLINFGKYVTVWENSMVSQKLSIAGKRRYSSKSYLRVCKVWCYKSI